jgi:hypothetical protein
MATQTAPSTKLISDKLVIDFPYLIKPKPGINGGEAKFGLRMRWPKSNKAFTEKVMASVDAAVISDKGLKTFPKGKPKNLKTPLKDGDDQTGEKEYPELKGHWYMQPSSKDRPGVAQLDGAGKPVSVEDDHEIASLVYGGMFGKVSLNFATYDTGTNKGVTCYINNVLALTGGTRTSGRANADDDFAGVDNDDEEL